MYLHIEEYKFSGKLLNKKLSGVFPTLYKIKSWFSKDTKPAFLMNVHI